MLVREHSMRVASILICFAGAMVLGDEVCTTAATNDISVVDNSLAQQALKLWSTPYSAQFSFPRWAADNWDDIEERFASTATIYHTSSNLPEVRTMAVFREPTNIAMDRKGSRRTLDQFYQNTIFRNSSKLNELFPGGKFSDDAERHATINAYYRNSEGHNDSACSDVPKYRRTLEGAYRFTTEEYLMPQIAAYAKTPMRSGTRYSNAEGVHVLNLVGAGFDAWQQPDYQHYFDKKTQAIRQDRQQLFYHERQTSFAYALQCAFDHGLDRIEFVAVGAGYFSAFLPPGTVNAILTSAWESEEVQAFKRKLEKEMRKVIQLSFRTEPPHTHCNGMGGGIPSWYKESGYSAQGQADNWQDAMNRTLFINAWDPWSLVGNGNELDNSVDGMYGRQSALALLCWPVTNSNIQYKKVQF